jgi:hypothetical protein
VKGNILVIVRLLRVCMLHPELAHRRVARWSIMLHGGILAEIWQVVECEIVAHLLWLWVRMVVVRRVIRHIIHAVWIHWLRLLRCKLQLNLAKDLPMARLPFKALLGLLLLVLDLTELLRLLTLVSLMRLK